MVEQILEYPQLYRWNVSSSVPDVRNRYLLVDRQEVLAVDPDLRTKEDWIHLEDAIQQIPGEKKLEKVFLTHLHSNWMDFSPELIPSSVKLLVSKADCRLSGQKEPWEYQRRWYRREGFPLHQLKEYNGEDMRWTGLKEDINTIEPGEIVGVGELKLRCLRLPGHTPGHTALFLPTEALAFSGDTLLLDRLPYVGVWKGHPHALEQYLDSLEILRNTALQKIFPAHGAWGDLPAQRIDDIVQYYYLRLLELYQLVWNHPGLTAYELASRFRWRQKPWETLTAKQQWFAMGETLAHLVYLRKRKYVETKRGTGYLINIPGKRKLTDM